MDAVAGWVLFFFPLCPLEMLLQVYLIEKQILEKLKNMKRDIHNTLDWISYIKKKYLKKNEV